MTQNDEDPRVDHTQYDPPSAEPLATAERNQQAPITADDLDNVRHMLGVSEKNRRGYRNYFVAGGKDVASMERLRALGFVVCFVRKGEVKQVQERQ